MDTLYQWIEQHQELLQLAAIASFGVGVVLFLAIPLITIWLPEDYLLDNKPAAPAMPKTLRIPFLFIKNLLGGCLFLAGVAMLLLPGQGLLAMVVGLALMDIPGKRKVIHHILAYPSVLRTINKFRRKAGKAPIKNIDPETEGHT